MAKENKELTPEQKATRRENMKKNLEGPLAKLAAIYYVESGELGDYGDKVSELLEQTQYLEALQSGELNDLFVGGLFGSRKIGKKGKEKGKRIKYSGTFSEEQLLENATGVIQQTFSALTIKDIAEYMKYKGPIKREYANSYLEDFRESNKELYNTIMSRASDYLVNKTLENTFGIAREAISGSLEEILNPSDKKKDNEGKDKE